jgi:predicted phage gp36 major capsid-like protein
MSSKPKTLKKGALNDSDKVFIFENRKEKTVEEMADFLNRSVSSVKRYLLKVDSDKVEKPVKKVESDPDFRTKKNKPEQTGVATVMTGSAADVANVRKAKRSEFLRKGF